MNTTNINPRTPVSAALFHQEFAARLFKLGQQEQAARQYSFARQYMSVEPPCASLHMIEELK